MAARRACTRLEAIPPSLPVHFIFADEGRSVLNEEILGKMLGLVPHATKARVKGAGESFVGGGYPRTSADSLLFQRPPHRSRRSQVDREGDRRVAAKDVPGQARLQDVVGRMYDHAVTKNVNCCVAIFPSEGSAGSL